MISLKDSAQGGWAKIRLRKKSIIKMTNEEEEESKKE